MASLLLPRARRRDLLAFYAFARGADDIADDPVLPAEDKQAQLESLRDALRSGDDTNLPPWALRYADMLHKRRLSPRHGEDLISAFLQDTGKQRYRDMEELTYYCQRSAAPVGRAMLELGGEEKADIAAADALCIALQLLNHLQDMSKDYLVLDRIYLPLDWLRQAGVAESTLMEQSTNPALRGVVNRMLEHCDALIAQSRSLPATVHSRRLRLEVRVIWNIAHLLSQKLRQQDPLATQVKLKLGDRMSCLWLAVKQEYA